MHIDEFCKLNRFSNDCSYLGSSFSGHSFSIYTCSNMPSCQASFRMATPSSGFVCPKLNFVNLTFQCSPLLHEESEDDELELLKLVNVYNYHFVLDFLVF